MKWLVVAATLIAALPAVAQQRSAWLARLSEAQRHSVSKLSAGYAGGILCDRLVDPRAAAAYLEKTFQGRPFSAEDMAEFGRLIIGTVALETAIAAGPDYCPLIRRSFGPHGSEIAGLVD